MSGILNMFMLMEAKKKPDDMTDGEKTEDPKVDDTQKTTTDDNKSSDDSNTSTTDTEDDSGDDLFADVDHESDMGTSGEGLDSTDDGSDDSTDTDTTATDDGTETSDDISDTGDDTSTDDSSDTTIDDTIKLKSQKLFSDYYELYSNVNDMITSLGNINELNSLEYTTISRTIDNLKQLSFSINTYMMNRFNTKTYEENLAMYYKMVNSIKITDKIISKIIENRNKG